MKLKTVTVWLSIAGCILLTTALGAKAQQQNTVVGTTAKPERRDVSEALIKQLKLPEGFEISIFAQNLGNPRFMAFGNDGTLYITRREQGDVIMLRDRNRDGRADYKRVVASNLKFVNGITIRENRLYLLHSKDFQP